MLVFIMSIESLEDQNNCVRPNLETNYKPIKVLIEGFAYTIDT